MNRSTDLEGVNDSINLSEVAKSPRFQMNAGVLRRQLTRLFVLMVHGFPLPMGMEREDRCE